MYDWCLAINELLKKGKTQQELAQTFRCTQPFISQMSRGEKNRVNYEMGERIKALCVIEGIEVKKQDKAEA